MLIATIAGSAAFLIWKLLLKLLRDRDLVLEDRMLRLACMFYVLPIGYLMAQTLTRCRYMRVDGIWQANFMTNKILIWAVIIPECIWGVMVIAHLVDFVKSRRGWIETCRCTVPECDPVVEEEFLRIKEKLHIRRNIELCRNCDLRSPMIAGIFHVRIILPEENFTREQLAVIFSHELTHHRSHDVFFRVCSACVDIIQCISPCAKGLKKQLCERSECECDRKATAAMCDEFTVWEYYTRILEMAGPESDESDGEEVFSMLFTNRLELERRIDYMRKLMNKKQLKWFTSAAMAVVFAVLSISTTYAAGFGLATVNAFLYKQTEPYAVTLTEIPNAEVPAGEIHFLPAEEAHTYEELVDPDPEEEMISPLLLENEVISFNWSMQPKARTRSSLYTFDTLNKIVISCTSAPSNQTYWVGIEDKAGNTWYTEATGSVMFKMRIPADGEYRIIVENRGTSNITAVGSYHYYELHKA